MNSPITRLECFPNELLLELFEYISPHDLYQIFAQLNARLNVLIHSLRNLRVILPEDWDREEQLPIPFHASQISTLIIKHDEPIHFSAYPNLRSLKLSMPTREQCNGIQAALLPHLEHLFISNLYFADHSEELCRLIFSSTFSRLQTCQIDRMTLDHSHSSSSSSLRQLILSPSTWQSNFYPIIFQSCPRLTHLTIQRLRKSSFSLAFDTPLLHTALRSLNMHFSSIGDDWFDQIDCLLSIVPNLEHFQLNIEQNEINLEFPFQRLAHLLTKHVPQLVNFQAKLAMNQVLVEQPRTIQRLHPLFFHVQFQRYTHRNLHQYLLISSKQQ